jgi:hypothetical protein
MRFFITKKTSFAEADKLIERYYDGLTTVEEEQKLHKFLMQTDLPEKYRAEQAMFGYLKANKKPTKFLFPVYLQRVAVVALILTSAFTIQTLVVGQNTAYAIVNGKKITNKADIETIAMNSLREITSTNNEVEEGLNAINNTKIVEQQLEVFYSIDNLK